MTEQPWLRARFYTTSVDDYRPIYEPPALPVGPWWCTGVSGDDQRATIVAYVHSEAELRRQWPEAEDIDAVPVEGVVFTDRFPRPDWWTV